MAVVALMAAVAVAAPACGGDDSTTTAEKSSASRSTTTERDTSGSTGSDGSSDSGPSDGGSSGDSPSDGGSGTMPDMSDLGELGDCLQIAGTWAGLALSALGGPEDAKQARAQAEELKATLPADLHDDLDVVADAFATVAEKGMIEGADALDTPEFNKANSNIEKYLEETCQAPGN